MTATLRKWATDLMVGAGIAVLGLVLLAGSGTALGVSTPGANGTCILNPDNSCKDLGAACKRDNGTPGTCQMALICLCSQ